MLIMPKLPQIKKVEALTPHDHNNRRSARDASNVSGACELSAAAASTPSTELGNECEGCDSFCSQ